MDLICKVVEDSNIQDKKNNRFVLLTLSNENKNNVNSEKCNVKDFCEKLPTMFEKLMKSNENHNQNNKNNKKVQIDNIVLDFDVSKNITTKRILLSFLCGILTNTEIIQKHLN